MLKKPPRSTDAASPAVPTVWRILWAKDDYLPGSLMLAIVSFLVFAVDAVKAWRGTSGANDRLLIPAGVACLLCTTVFVGLMIHRVRFVRQLFATGQRVQAKIQKIEPCEFQSFRRRLLNPQVVMHCTWRIAGAKHKHQFTIGKSVAGELDEFIWLRVSATDPEQAIIEQFYN
ncbi:MAG: hypothetical protein AB7O62_04015 [Pirellulales bacterium]